MWGSDILCGSALAGERGLMKQLSFLDEHYPSYYSGHVLCLLKHPQWFPIPFHTSKESLSLTQKLCLWFCLRLFYCHLFSVISMASGHQLCHPQLSNYLSLVSFSVLRTTSRNIYRDTSLLFKIPPQILPLP